ncbi:hypothetical protein [Enhygromyxa salina]|uniref:hypothetical protein n=1 Tax=Enhygromyxa salina TaxID=215803 RepID=UPI0015E5EE94|nr:hypothetical protein [Enhygromyxa salina]
MTSAFAAAWLDGDEEEALRACFDEWVRGPAQLDDGGGVDVRLNTVVRSNCFCASLGSA